jgi:2-amino-4-hydroxy-6-hydroxymethyldihydropteridine diphosphokinase
MSLAFLILGGNRGNRREIFSTAIDLVTSEIGVIKAVSSHYESESWGFISEVFMNQVIKIETNLSPTELLNRIQHIESKLGRIRKTSDYEGRTIDIDILYYGEMVINTPDLTVPHPRIAERRFVLVPLAEIEPDFKDPVSGLTAQAMLEKCPDNLQVKRIE